MSSSFQHADERRRDEAVSSEFSAKPQPRPGGSSGRVHESEGHADRLQESEGHADRLQESDGRTSRSGELNVSITLLPNQVDHVMRTVLGDDAGPSTSALVAGSGFHRSHARQALGARYRSLQRNRRLSRSLLSGLLVLSCFPARGVDLGIKDISKELDLNTSTVHRYVLTLVAAGLLERDPDTRRYRLLAE